MPRNAGNSRSSTVHICVQLLTQLNAASAAALQFLCTFLISAPAFQFPGAISDHFNAAFHTLRSYLSRLARIQLITQFNQIITSIIITLQTFLQLKYQGTNYQSKSAFATHPRAMHVAVASSVAHYLACAAAIRFPEHRFAFLAHHLLVSSGNIAIASLASVMLPNKVAPFVYAIFGLVSAARLLCWLYRKLIAVCIRRWHFRYFWNYNNNNNNYYYYMFGNWGSSSNQWMRMRLHV